MHNVEDYLSLGKKNLTDLSLSKGRETCHQRNAKENQ